MEKELWNFFKDDKFVSVYATYEIRLVQDPSLETLVDDKKIDKTLGKEWASGKIV